MSNLTTTKVNYTTQITLSLEVEENSTQSKRQLAPTFKPYDNRQIHWNTIFEEMKAKAKTKPALGCEEKAAIYSQRKVDVESVFGHIKGNRSFRRFSLRGLDKVHVEFGIVALIHNLLKVATIRLTTLLKQFRSKKQMELKLSFISICFYFLVTY